jgi:hypothetical protein
MRNLTTFNAAMLRDWSMFLCGVRVQIKSTGKEAGIWKKDVEIAYEDLIYAINYMQVRQPADDFSSRDESC